MGDHKMQMDGYRDHREWKMNLQFIWNCIDCEFDTVLCVAGDGLIQEAELQHVMRACMDENGMSFDEESVEELTRALYQDAASSLQPGITYASLKSQISKHDGLLENLTISIDRWLVPPKPKRIIQVRDGGRGVD